MSSADGQGDAGGSPSSDPSDLKLVAVIPVADADRSKKFYAGLVGWRLDADLSFGNGLRVLQFTDRSARCSSAPATQVHHPASPMACT